MSMMPTDEFNRTEQDLNQGVCEYLAEMILEAQQMALRIGAAEVSTQLQAAYLEAQILRKRIAAHPVRGGSRPAGRTDTN